MIHRTSRFVARIAAAALLLGLPLALPAAAAAAQTAQERAQIDWVQQRGRLMFGLDRAAWVGTDDMMERIGDVRASGIRGYIVEPQQDGFDVIFYASEGDALVQAYRGRVSAGGVVSRELFPAGARPPLTALQRRMVAAVQAAAGTGRRPCGNRPFNPLVIPPAQPDGPIDVYLMTPQLDRQLPFGGHYRVTVAADGSVSDSRAFTNSCLMMPPAPAGAAGLGINHLLDQVPTEIHVFSAMAAGVPVFVGTQQPRRMWEVTGERISLVPAR